MKDTISSNQPETIYLSSDGCEDKKAGSCGQHDRARLSSGRPVESTEDDDYEHATYVERTDVGVSLTVKLKRGTGTRDQDEVIAKAKGSTLEDAREDMNELREYIRDLAEDARQIQPDPDPDPDE